MRTLATILLFGGLTACGPLAEDSLTARFAAGMMAQQSASPAPSTDPRAGLTREAIERSEYELVLLALVDSNLAATAQLASRNGDKVTWITLDGVSITFDNGIIVGTRGLGDDIMGADISDVEAALARGGGSATRVNDYLNGLDQIERRSFHCEIEALGTEMITIVEQDFATRHFVENCVSTEHAFENQYWLKGDGSIVQSRQWISPLVGYLDHQNL